MSGNDYRQGWSIPKPRGPRDEVAQFKEAPCAACGARYLDHEQVPQPGSDLRRARYDGGFIYIQAGGREVTLRCTCISGQRRPRVFRTASREQLEAARQARIPGRIQKVVTDNMEVSRETETG